MSFYITKKEKCLSFITELRKGGAKLHYPEYKFLRTNKGPFLIKVDPHDLKIFFIRSAMPTSFCIDLDNIDEKDFSNYSRRYLLSFNLKVGQYITPHGSKYASKIVEIDSAGWIKRFKTAYNIDPGTVSYPTITQIFNYSIKCLSTLPN